MKRILSFILILILVLSLTSCKQKPLTPGNANIDNVTVVKAKAQYVRANAENPPKLPYVAAIRSTKALKEYAERFAVDADRDNSQYSDGTISFNMVAEKYTDDYFINNQLYICMLLEPSGSIRHEVDTLRIINDEDIEITINRIQPEVGTDDMALWHIFVETEQNDIDDDDIEIYVDGKNETHPIDVKYAKGAIGINLTLKPDWRYSTIETDNKYGVSIWHKDSADKNIDIFYRTEPVGLCGTGLSNETVTIGSYTATAYRYDDLPGFFMINFDTVSGGYYIENLSLPIESRELEEIIKTLSLSDTTMTREEALKIAKEQTTREYTEEFANYDALNGNWEVVLRNAEWTETYQISENGHSMTATQNQSAKSEPEPEQHDYSKKFDYFENGHDFWNGEGATLVSANCPKNDIKLSLYIPKDWEYQAVDYSSDKTNFGIYFWPKGEQNGKIYVCYDTDNRELGCGTGIDFKDIRLGNFDATVVTYVSNDINPYMWNHITVANKTNNVRIYSGDAYLWWHQNYETAIKIMSSLTVEENACSVYEAIAAVEQYTGKIGEFNAGGNYYFDGNYWMIFGKSQDRYKVTFAEPLVVEPVE